MPKHLFEYVVEAIDAQGRQWPTSHTVLILGSWDTQGFYLKNEYGRVILFFFSSHEILSKRFSSYGVWILILDPVKGWVYSPDLPVKWAEWVKKTKREYERHLDRLKAPPVTLFGGKHIYKTKVAAGNREFSPY